MRIGILTNTYPPNLNGVSVAVVNLEKALKKLGHEVYIATPAVENVTYSKNILPLKSVKVPDKISLDLQMPYLFFEEAKKFFQSHEVEIIHTHDTMVGGPEGALIGFQLGIPAVHTFHTLIESYDYFDFPGYKRFLNSYIRDVCNLYDHLIAPSEKIYKYLLSKGVYKPISQIFNVFSAEEFHPVEQRKLAIFREKFGLKPGDFVITTFCRLAKEKGLDLAIDSLIPILREKPDVKFLIGGSGPYQKELLFQVKKLNLEKQILFFGKYERSDLPYLTGLSNLFLFTSTTENLPTNLWEAMYLGLPVVAIDDESVDYILEHEQNGLKVPKIKLTSTVQFCIENPEKLREMSKKAKQSASVFSPESIALEHVKIYQGVLNLEKENNLSAEQSRFLRLNFLDKLWSNGVNAGKQIYTNFKKIVDSDSKI